MPNPAGLFVSKPGGSVDHKPLQPKALKCLGLGCLISFSWQDLNLSDQRILGRFSWMHPSSTDPWFTTPCGGHPYTTQTPESTSPALRTQKSLRRGYIILLGLSILKVRDHPSLQHPRGPSARRFLNPVGGVPPNPIPQDTGDP